jgi:phosphomannomutase
VTLIKSISGIRGTIGGPVGENLTPIDIVECTAAFARWIIQKGNKPKVVVGRDGRISGPMVEQLVISTLNASGIEVVSLGLSTTPTVEMFVVKEKAGAGIILTASHNPKIWNALKFLNEKGEFISAEDGEEILNTIATQNYEFVEVDHLGSTTYADDAIAHHVSAILEYKLVQVEAIKSQQYHLVVDCINSTGALAIPSLLDALGCTYTLLNEEINGQFAHNPEPLPHHLTALSQKVVETGAHMGIAVDPDVDRLALILPDGSMFGEENTIVGIAEYFLRELGKGNTVSNLSSSRALKDITEKYGGQYAAAKVGEVNVVQKMKETQAVFGGEGNGGVIVPDFHMGRDAMIGIALILSYMAKYQLSLQEIKDRLPVYEIIKDKIELSEDWDLPKVFSQLEAHFPLATINREDGVKFDLPEGWVHFRKSNTEPIMRIYCEAKDQATAKEFVQQFTTLMQKLL